MTQFSSLIHHVVTTALSDLGEAQAKGKIPHNPLSETHFLAAWTTNAIKKKRFDSEVVPTLIIWQRKARSLGKNAGLVQTFKAIKSHYEAVFDEDLKGKVVNKTQIDAFCQQLIELDWMVNTDLVVGEKLNRHSAGKASLIICSDEYEQHIEKELLIKQLSVYIRGDVKEALSAAFAHQLLLYKVTDYKSKVKYHGEYIIYPNNNGTFLPELLVTDDEQDASI